MHMATTRSNYHHGDLKAALVGAATDIIEETGVEGFSLREAARRAGVAASAPAHHFGSAKGLLTEVALRGYVQLGTYLGKVTPSEDPRADLTGISLAYVRFALDHPGLFRLMFRNDLVNRQDPRYRETSMEALGAFGRAAGAYGTVQHLEPTEAVIATWSAIHGLAHLMLEEKLEPLLGQGSSRDLLDTRLPQIVAAIWQAGRQGASRTS